METVLACPGCQRSLRIPAALQGKRIRCRCGHLLAIPAGSEPEFPAVRFAVRIKDDPDEILQGVYRAQANSQGLDWERAKTPTIHIPRGTPAQYLRGNLLALTLGEREVTVAVEQINLYTARLARDIVRFLEGERTSLQVQDYKVPWYLLAAALLPCGILAVGIQGGAIGGALAGCLGGGLIGANLGVIRWDRWPLAARLGASLGLSVLGYAILVCVAVLVWPRVRPPANGAPPAAQPLPVEAAEPAVAAGAKTPPPPTEMPGLVAYWSFDDGSTQAADGSGHGHDGTLTGAASVPGVRGRAVRFRGAGYFDYGAAPAFNFAKNQPFTVAGWVQTTAQRGPVLSQRNADQEAPVLDLTLEYGSLVGVVRPDGAAGMFARVGTMRPINDGRWHHFALVRRAGHLLELYLDGQMQRWLQADFFAGPITTTLRSAGSERYWAAHGGGSPVSFTGALDELCIFDRDLDLHEIQRLAGR